MLSILDSRILLYEKDEEIWMIESRLNPKVSAICKALFSTLLLGKHTWQVIIDNKCQAGKAELSVKLITCVDGQFICDDETCISIAQRCDRARHCKDWSYEIGCSILQIPQGHIKELVPIDLADNL